MQQWHPPYAAGHFVPCTGFTMLWHRDDRHFAYTPPRIEFCIIMGSHLFLHIGVLFPGNGYESGIAGIEQPVPTTALLSHLRRPGTQRIQYGLFLVQLYGVIDFYVTSFLRASPVEGSFDIL